MMIAVYAMLTHAGALSGAAYPGGATGADTLTNLANGLFGRVGQVLLAAIFVIACFNTCVGLIACVGQYFHSLLPRIPYPAIAAFFAAASMVISNLGLAGIIRLSTPDLPGRDRADRAVVHPGAGAAPVRLSAMRRTDRRAERRGGAAAARAGEAAGIPAVCRDQLRLGTPGTRRSCAR